MLTINSRYFKSVDRTMLEGSDVKGDGQILVLVNENGVTCARPSTGVGKEIFGGILISSQLPQTHGSNVEEFKITSSSVRLARKPESSQLLVRVDGSKKTVTTGTAAPVDATKVTLTPNGELMFHADHLNKAGFVQYHYELTASEARALTGDYFAGVHNTPVYSTGVAAAGVEGTYQTDMFDASADWSGIIHPFIGADGRFAADGDTELTNVKIMESPNSGSPFLTVEVGN
jgi:hypothetical protein